MTRENKVALVIGFALVLLVGILISDHLSKAQTQRSANLVPASNRNDAATTRAARLIDLSSGDRYVEPQPVPSPIPETSAAKQPRVADDLTPVVDTRLAEAPLPPPAAVRVHEVRPGEALSTICVRYYGVVGLTGELAEYNGLSDPDMLWAGRQIKIPPPNELSGEPIPMPPPELPPPQTDPPTYTVRPGDSLSAIAQRFLSSAGQWQTLYEFNRDVISDPDEVRAGTILRLPALLNGAQ